MFYLKLLLLHTMPRSFLLARIVDGTVHKSFQAAARALGLLDDDNEGFTEAVESGYSPSDTGSGWSTSTGSPGEQQRYNLS